MSFHSRSAKPGRLGRIALAALTCAPLFLGGCTRFAQGPPVVADASHPSSLPSTQFVDVAARSGIDYTWSIAGKRPLNILQTIGNGCAFLDYDQDGNLDVLLVGPKLALYRGDGRGTFADVTRQAGLDKITGHSLGCAVGDYDNDGFPDIYVSAYRGGVLLRNVKGKFEDVTQAAGLKPQPWGTSCAWAETTPGSGRLDLFVANYARFSSEPGIPQLCPIKDVNGKEIQTSCGPRYYKPLKSALYRNDGGGHFTDISKQSGLSETTGRGLGVAFADFDNSGTPGIALANDEIAGDLLQRMGKSGPYANIGGSSGTAYDRDGNVHGGMGVDWGDYDNDGRFDLLVSTFQNEVKALYHNDGDSVFTESAYPSGVGAITSPNVAFGCKFFDYDNDGNLDVILANGHVQDNIHQIDASAEYRQPIQLLRSKGTSPASFADVSGSSGSDLQKRIVGRGLAVGDYDNDGKVDVLVVDAEGSPLLLHNQDQTPAHWLGIKLVGTRSNKDGYGAIVTATVGGKKLMRQCQSDGSYLSASDARVHFGLGAADKVETLTVKWPSGKTDTFQNLPADKYITLTEGRTR